MPEGSSHEECEHTVHADNDCNARDETVRGEWIVAMQPHRILKWDLSVCSLFFFVSGEASISQRKSGSVSLSDVWPALL